MEIKDTKTKQNTQKQNKKKLSTLQIIIICLAAFIVVFTVIVSVIVVNKDDNNNYGITSSTEFTIYNETWTIYHKDNKITSIYCFYQYNDQTSQYWKDLAKKQGDSSIYVTHSITKNGKPSNEQNWYIIEETETIMNGWTKEVLFEKTIKYTQKLIFDLSQSA